MTIEDIIRTNDLPLSRKLTINLLYTSNWANDILSEHLKPFEVSQQQFNVLRILRGQKGNPANLSTINDRMVTKMSNTTRLVDKLIQKGYVERIICQANRRKVEITITKDGLSLLNTIDPAVATAEKQINSELTSVEQDVLNTLLNKLRH